MLGRALLSEPDNHRGCDPLGVDRIAVPSETPLQVALLQMPLDLGHIPYARGLPFVEIYRPRT